MAAQLPTLRFKLSEHPEAQFDGLIPPEAVQAFANALSIAATDARDILCYATEAYLGGTWDRFAQKSEKQDNAALTKVASDAARLEGALSALIDHPNLEPQLEARIRSFETLASNASGQTLPDLMGRQHNIFHFVREMLIDLQACAEETCNHKPKRADYDDAFQMQGFPTAQESFDVDTAEYKRRSKARKLGDGHALQCLLLAIHPHWLTHTGQPFSEGMYFKEIKGTLSPTIAALHPIAALIDTSITPQRIATAIRTLRETGKL
jgi:hypothetical protein